MFRNFSKGLNIIANFDNTVCCFIFYPLTLIWNYLQLPRVRQSKVTRLRYISVLVIVSTISMFMISTKSYKYLTDSFCFKIGYHNCEYLHGVGPVYRMLFTVFLFFSIMAVLLIGVENSLCTRATIHNQLWIFKSIILLGCTIASIFLPRSIYTGEVWHFFGLNGGFAVIIVQFLFLIDAVHIFNSKVISLMEYKEYSNSSKLCFLMLWIPTSIFYIGSLFGTVMFYKRYSSKTDCVSNLFFVSFHVYMCVAATFISIHPVIQEVRPKSGLLQSSIASAYSTYILMTALSNQPDGICNPSRNYLYPIDSLKNEQIIISLVLNLFIISIFSLRSVKSPQYGKTNSSLNKQNINGKQSNQTNSNDNTSNKESENNELPKKLKIVYDDEYNGVEYSYSFFHTVIGISALYTMMVLTNWYRPEEEENLSVKLIAGWGAVWMKICSGIFCVFLYIWSMVAPLLFPNSYKELVFYELFFTVYS
ncbi:probable serine incorporator [Hydra vulgaris]|uniref:Probable serine incorporator n=1 Tax=Hydra vulgaris TaxID=6087 RepID=A0ABM4BJA0_HYDVU